MAIVILLYDQFLFRPLVTWGDKFRYELTANQQVPHSWVRALFLKSRLAQKFFSPLSWLAHSFINLRLFTLKPKSERLSTASAKLMDYVWYGLLSMAGVVALYHLFIFLRTSIGLDEIISVMGMAGLTLARVVILITLASALWVPLGIYIGLRPKLAQIIQPLAQFLAAFPANLLFPVAVLFIHGYSLNPDIWLSPLMILGTQWYILFNVVAGASAFPNDLREASKNFGVSGLLWWRKVIIPGIFPYFLTGAITACGGAWNASIVAEMVSWGDTRYVARGLGSYIAQMTEAGDFAHIALGVGIMALMVVTFNKCVWRPLYGLAARKLRFD